MLTFAAVAVVLLLGLVGYLVVQRTSDVRAQQDAAQQEEGRERLDPADVLAVPHLVVRNTESGPSYGKVALVPLDDPTGPRAVLDISCDRVDAVAAGAICLQTVEGLVPSYRTVFLDSAMNQVGEQELGGIPSRARMSDDGRWAATTAFVAGHAYTDAQFSTETVITDMSDGASLGNLESWTTLQNGVVVDPTDRNFWGVTFLGDGPTFYATFGSSGERHLVRGDATTRTLTVLDTEGACPSVSPDGSTVVYKRRDPVSGSDSFVVDTMTGAPVVPLDEGRYVDDQVSWLDDSTVLYSVGKGVSTSSDFDVWAAPVDGTAPRVLVPDAASPSVVRPG